MFKDLRIQNFRAISDLQMEGFGRRLNILLGANNTGKTSVLESLFLLSGMGNLQLPIKIQSFRLFGIGKAKDLANLFNMLNLEREIEIGANLNNNDHWHLRIAPSYGGGQVATLQPNLGNGHDANKQRSGGLFAPSMSTSPDMQGIDYTATVNSENSELFKGNLQVTLGEMVSGEGNLQVTLGGGMNITAPKELQNKIILAEYLHSKQGHNAGLIGRVLIEKRKAQILETLQELDPSIQDIANIGNRTYLDIGAEEMLPINMFGDGTMSIVQKLTSASVGDVKVLLIDQIEDGLHHKGIQPLLRALLDLSQKRDLQLFISTHSIDVLESLQKILEIDNGAGFRSDIACYSLVRGKDEMIRAYRYEYEEFEHCIRNAIEIR